MGSENYSSFPFWVKSIFRFFRYADERRRFLREIKIRQVQNYNLKTKVKPDCKNLIIFFVPGADRKTGKETISGGVISLVSLCEESGRLKDVYEAETLMCVFPRDFLFLKHQNFENQTDLYRFEQLPDHFRNIHKLIIHLPELLVPYFKDRLHHSELNWINSVEYVHINIVNANIQLMPPSIQIDLLDEIADKITITAAHSKYCTLEYRKLYNRPLHKFSAWISPEHYIFQPYNKKENLLVVSPDDNAYRDVILKKLSSIEGLKIIILQSLSYEKFKDVIGRAKWALTFGEGLDGYILEPIFSGAFGMAVYNEDFFTADFKEMPGIYHDYETLSDLIVGDISTLNNEANYTTAQRQQFNICAKHYNYQQYRENIRKFYLGDYTFK